VPTDSVVGKRREQLRRPDAVCDAVRAASLRACGLPLSKRSAIEQIGHNTTGVKAVNDGIVVRGQFAYHH